MENIPESTADLFSRLVDFKMPDIAPISSMLPPLPGPAKLNPAKWTYECLCKYIQDFEAKLDETQEIGARLVSFGPALVFHIEDMGYHGPNIISFTGTNDNGERLELIQNVNQLNVVLVAMKKKNDKPRRIGFRLAEPPPEPAK